MASGLTTIERAKLENYETIIEDGLQTCFDVGRALLSIRDERLYRITHKTFEDYCGERWQLSRPRAYQLIESAAVAANLSTNVDKMPTNEAQTRQLAKLPPPEQAEAWQEVVEESNGKPTAKDVEAVVNKRLGKTPAVSLYVCPTCAKKFKDEVWHCDICAHHWPIEKDACSNCHGVDTKEVLYESTPQMSADVLYDDLCAIIDRHKKRWSHNESKEFIAACVKAASYAKKAWRE